MYCICRLIETFIFNLLMLILYINVVNKLNKANKQKKEHLYFCLWFTSDESWQFCYCIIKTYCQGLLCIKFFILESTKDSVERRFFGTLFIFSSIDCDIYKDERAVNKHICFKKNLYRVSQKPILYLNYQKDNSNHRDNRHAKSFPPGIMQAYIRTSEDQSKHS